MGFFDFLGAVKHEEPLRHRRIRRDSSVRTMEAVLDGIANLQSNDVEIVARNRKTRRKVRIDAIKKNV